MGADPAAAISYARWQGKGRVQVHQERGEEKKKGKKTAFFLFGWGSDPTWKYYSPLPKYLLK